MQELGENDETNLLESDTSPNRNATKLIKRTTYLAFGGVGGS